MSRAKSGGSSPERAANPAPLCNPSPLGTPRTAQKGWEERGDSWGEASDQAEGEALNKPDMKGAGGKGHRPLTHSQVMKAGRKSYSVFLRPHFLGTAAQQKTKQNQKKRVGTHLLRNQAAHIHRHRTYYRASCCSLRLSWQLRPHTDGEPEVTSPAFSLHLPTPQCANK